MKTTEKKDLVYYLSLPYTTILRRDDDGDVVARIAELEGCISHGRDEAEALSNLSDMKSLWIEDAISSREAIPEPQLKAEDLPSGKWVQRVPRSLHKKLAQMAKREGVSLNQLVATILSRACSSASLEISA